MDLDRPQMDTADNQNLSTANDAKNAKGKSKAFTTKDTKLTK